MVAMRRREGWMGTAEMAEKLGCSPASVRRTFADPTRADELYGAGNWTDKPSPVTARRAFQVRSSVVLALARRAGFVR